jgi:DNA polymerase III epsilon subunit family exonuclease
MSISLLQPLREIPLAFVDVETTGASADFGHRVIEIGIARVENGRVVSEYQHLLDPQRRISAGVTALTGITQPMVTGQPTFDQELPAMLELLRGAVVVGHNVRFDLGFLRKEFRRCRQDICTVLGAETHVLDTVRIARRRFGRGGNGLQALARRFGIVVETAHRALADVRTTIGVMQTLLEPQGAWNLPLCDTLLAQGGKMGLLPANPRESLLPLELEEALELRKPVMMEYLDAREARTHRVIEPRFIRRVSGELMLVAHCQLRQAQRTFKLERIVQLTRIEEGTPIPVEPQPQVERVNVEQVEVVTPPQVETIVEEAMVAPLEPEIISPDANRCADPAPAEFLHTDASSDLPSS